MLELSKFPEKFLVNQTKSTLDYPRENMWLGEKSLMMILRTIRVVFIMMSESKWEAKEDIPPSEPVKPKGKKSPEPSKS